MVDPEAVIQSSPGASAEYLTTGTSFTVPSGVLENGKCYAVTIEADSFHNSDAGTSAAPVGYSHVTPCVIIMPAAAAASLQHGDKLTQSVPPAFEIALLRSREVYSGPQSNLELARDRH